MKKAVILVSVLLSSTGLAQTSAGRGARVKASYDPNKIVCVNVRETGSRIATSRVCMTQLEWDQMRRNQRQLIDRVQTTRIHSSG